MKVYFARHGESEANVLHVISNRPGLHGLTDQGRQQAAALAEILCGCGIRHIYTSPLLRALQTADIVAQALGPQAEVEVTDALREYDCGVIEGRSDAESWALHQALRDAWFRDHEWTQRIEGGESLDDIRARFVPFLDGLCAEYGGSDTALLLVGHGGTYQAMLPLALRGVDWAFAAAQPFPNTAYVLAEQRPVGLVCVSWCGREVSCTAS